MIDSLTYVNLKKIERNEKVNKGNLLNLQKNNYIDKNNHLLPKAKDEIKNFDNYVHKEAKSSVKLLKLGMWITWISILLCGLGIVFEWPNFNVPFWYIIIAIGIFLLLKQPTILKMADKKV